MNEHDRTKQQNVKQDTLQLDQHELIGILLERTRDAVAIINKHGKLLWGNPTWYGWFDKFDSHVTIVDTKDLKPAWIALIENGVEIQNYEFRIKNSNAVDLVFEINAFPISGNDNTIFCLIAHNISRFKNVEQQLAEERDLLQSLMNSIPDKIYFKDIQSRFTRINKAQAEILGVNDPNDAVGKNDFNYFTPKHARAAYHDEQQIISSREPVTDKIEKIRIADGRYRWVSTTKVPLVDTSGNVNGIVGITRDVTERVNSENERAKLEAQLLQSQKMEAIGKLAGGIAHDFNNLLTAILGNTDLLMAEVPRNSQMFDDLDEIKRASERAASLTSQLLAFSRQQPLERKIVDINELIENIERLLQRLIGENIKLTTHLQRDIEHILIDSGQISQVLMNLVVNSRDALPEAGGEIRVRTSSFTVTPAYQKRFPYAQKGDFICITVSDSGRGIARRIIHRIFDPFYTTKPAGRGSGLGLSVAYGIIKQHDGWINVRSTVGRGTVFKVYIPVHTIHDDDELNSTTIKPHLSGNGEVILFVEDDDRVRHCMARALIRHNYQVHTASSVRDAMNIYETAIPSIELVICDVVLPDKNGIQFAEDLEARQPDVKIILNSGYIDEKSQWRRIEEKGWNFIQKPYSLQDFLAMVRTTIEQPQAG
ncbi:PAS domain S-box protein [candidate division KSB1 bacterium]|nr:PAS domain S-box protein [candidate division KSB1 bacterium]